MIRDRSLLYLGSLSQEISFHLSQGTTSKCLPSICFPIGWDVNFTENHWSNESTMEDYLNNILFPYITRVRTTSNLDASNSALVIYDTFRGQCTERILGLLEDNNVYVAIVPANCTDHLQPLNLSVNKVAKEFLCREFNSWYSDQICDQLHRGIKPAKSVDLRLRIVKPLGPQ